MSKFKLFSLSLAVFFMLFPLVFLFSAPFRTQNDLSAPSSPPMSNDSANQSPSQQPNDAPKDDTLTNSPNDAPSNVPNRPTDAPTAPDEPSSPNTPNQPTENDRLSRQLYVVCTANSVNLRTGAGTQHSVVSSAAKNTAYAVLSVQNGWYCVYYRGQEVYLSKNYVREFYIKKSDDSAIENVLQEAYKLIGTPYVYGTTRVHDGKGNLLKGFKTSEFDCSSLTQYTFFKGANVKIGTTTRIQVKEGKHVEKSNLQRGDCIYYTNASRYYNTGVERIGHVAIYLGDDYILHTSSDYARIEKLTASRNAYYVQSRRFL